MRISLAITHTPWIESRRPPFNRLLQALGPDHLLGVLENWEAYKVFDEKAPNYVWSAHMWEWAAAQDVDYCLFLQDDAIVPDNFRPLLESMLSGMWEEPPAIIGLEVAHPAAHALHEEGYRWFTTADALIGVGYIVSRHFLKRFLDWRMGLEPDVIRKVSEDTLLGLFCALDGTRILHPLPTIVDHDTSIPSTYGNDKHTNRRPLVTWNNALARANPDFWAPVPRVPHMGCFYETTHRYAREVFHDPDWKELARDTGFAEQQRLYYQRRARGDTPAKSLYIALPNRGAISPFLAASIWRLREEEINVEFQYEIVDVQQWQADIVRARNRYVHHFLTRSTATHLLFLDSDIEFAPQCIRGMLHADRGFVASPYPRRDTIDFLRVRALATSDVPAEALAYRYSARIAGILEPDAEGCAPVDGLPMGCALISRELLQSMSDKADSYLDTTPIGDSYMCANLFGLIADEKGLLSEDYSFCRRVAEHGEKVWIYLGEGSPVTHHGTWAYHGAVESFGLRRG